MKKIFKYILAALAVVVVLVVLCELVGVGAFLVRLVGGACTANK